MSNFKLPIGPDGIPLLGFGTGTVYYKADPSAPINESLVNTLVEAVAQGFTHIDTAENYGVYREIAAALRLLEAADVKRSDLFITDKYTFGAGKPVEPTHLKVTPYHHLKRTLQTLQTDYVDLYLLHSPFITKEKFGFTLEEAWASMELALSKGLAKRIGVSNFAVEDLERLLKVAKHKPEANQIEFHAFLQSQTPGIVAFSKKNGIVVEAYSPLASLTKTDHSAGVPKELFDKLTTLGKKYGKTPTQITLRWVIQNGIVPISTTFKKSRFDEWKGVFDFELEADEVQAISDIGKKEKPQLRLYWKPEYDKFN